MTRYWEKFNDVHFVMSNGNLTKRELLDVVVDYNAINEYAAYFRLFPREYPMFVTKFFRDGSEAMYMISKCVGDPKVISTFFGRDKSLAEDALNDVYEKTTIKEDDTPVSELKMCIASGTAVAAILTAAGMAGIVETVKTVAESEKRKGKQI